MPENLLIKIPGQYISAGWRYFPAAATAVDHLQQSIVDVPGIGRVRLTCKRFKH